MVAFVQVLKGLAKSADGLLVEFVLVTLQVAELSELLVAFVKTAGERLCCSVNNFVLSHCHAERKSCRIAHSYTDVRQCDDAHVS